MTRIWKTTFHELLMNIILETEDLRNFTKIPVVITSLILVTPNQSFHRILIGNIIVERKFRILKES